MERSSLFFITTCLVLLTLIFIFAMKFFYLSRKRPGGRLADPPLLESAIKAAETNTAALNDVRNSLAEIQRRLSSVEKILKDVE